jgi:hypothetical protein
MYINYDDEYMYLVFFRFFMGGGTPTESRYGIKMILICREMHACPSHTRDNV